MQFTFDYAQKAMKRVQSRWGSAIPAPLLQYTAKQIFVFDSQKYKHNFNVAYNALFHKGTQLPCPDCQRLCRKLGSDGPAGA